MPDIVDAKISNDPMDRLTNLADHAVTAMETSTLSSGAEQGVILLRDGTQYGSASFGLDNVNDTITLCLIHIGGICKAAGLDLATVLAEIPQP